MSILGYAAFDASTSLKPYTFSRRHLRDDDVDIEILYCGVCHSDLHVAKNDWGGTPYPIVPGHEIVGRVKAVGRSVTKYSVGDSVAVGCLIDSCLDCDYCRRGDEQLCREGSVGTYGGKDRLTGDATQGGYSASIVVREEFVLRVPSNMQLDRVAPLLCAGITTYSPMRQWNVRAGSRVAILGLGGLGHVAVKIAVALGAEVTAISTSRSKEVDAKAWGAQHFLDSGDACTMEKSSNAFDVIINTIPTKHDINPYMPLLDVEGVLVLVGQIGMLPEFSTLPMMFGRRRITASNIGGIAETQEVLDLCSIHGILPECEIIAISQINEAFERLLVGDVRYRFVIDMKTLG